MAELKLEGAAGVGWGEAPRRVRLRRGKWWRIWLMRVVSLVFLVPGVFFGLLLASGPLVREVGREVEGRVEDLRPGAGQTGERVRVEYSYEVGGGVRARSYWIADPREGSPPGVGTAVGVRVLEVGRWRWAVLAYEGPGTGDGSGACLILWVVAWCGLTGVKVIRAWVGPVLQRRLLRNGKVAAGVVVERKEPVRRGGLPRIRYRFVAADGSERGGSTGVSREEFERLAVGAGVTVVYEPERGGWSALYEGLMYEVERER